MRPLIYLTCFLLFRLGMFAQDDLAAAKQKQYEENIVKEEINGIYIPYDIEDAMTQLNLMANEESRAKLIGIDEDVVVERLNKGLGRWMMVNWSFFEGSRLSHHLRQMGVSIPEDMAEFLITTYYRELNNIDIEIKSRAKAIYERRKKEQEQRNEKKKVQIIPN